VPRWVCDDPQSPSVITLYAVESKSRGIAAIAVAIAVFVLSVLDVIDANAAHEIKGIARDVDVCLFIPSAWTRTRRIDSASLLN
jgi:hypothetical protein